MSAPPHCNCSKPEGFKTIKNDPSNHHRSIVAFCPAKFMINPPFTHFSTKFALSKSCKIPCEMTPEGELSSLHPPFHLDFQTLSTPLLDFQFAICRGGVDFFWNNPLQTDVIFKSSCFSLILKTLGKQ